MFINSQMSKETTTDYCVFVGYMVLYGKWKKETTST